MVSRSQAHLTRMGRYTSGGANPVPAPPITGIAPDTATLAAAGIAGRIICTVVASGGTPPYTYALTANGGLSAQIIGQNMLTTADPVGVVGAHAPSVTATDSRGQTKTEIVTVTLT